jgi:hypothetical protein
MESERSGRLIRLVEPGTGSPAPRIREGQGGWVAAAAAAGPMPIESGEHDVGASIEVTFAPELT